MRLKFLLLSALGLLLAGCQSLSVPELKLPQAWRLGTTQAAVTPNTTWWEGLGNPQLNELISASLVRSPTVAQALARVKEAQGLQLQIGSRLWPSAAVGAGVREVADDGNSLIRTGGLEAAWELDLFGGNRANARAARANARAAEAAAALARVSLIAAVARTYGTLWAQQQAVAAAQASQVAATEEFRIIQARAQAGLVPPTELARSAEQQANLSAQLARAQQAAAETAGALAVLSGLPLTQIETLTSVTTLVQPVSLTHTLATPLEVLRHRPDVQLARAELETRIAETDAARALRWPTLTLGSVLGLGGWSSTPNSVAASAALPLLNFGAIRGAIKAADARAQAALIGFEAAVHAALSEVEIRLAQMQAATTQLAQQQAAYKAAQQAEALVRVRSTAGLESPAALPRTTYATQSAANAAANAQASYLGAYANLFTALAGAVE